MAQRVFLKNLGRYQVGDVRDWDRSTWSQFPNYEKLTAPIEDVLQAGLKAILNKENSNGRKISA